jgi:chorismate dehydratase
VKKLRVGAVHYLNTKPLIRHLPALAPEIDLVLDAPSRLAVELEAGRLDIGLVPSIEYFRHGRYTILPDVSISSFGPVLSVKLCSRLPFAHIRSLAVDEGSRSSAALATILLDQLFHVRPAMLPLSLDQTPDSTDADAMLLIGDRAMRVVDGDFPFILDLGYEWSRWTGLPFVFAFWAVAEGVEVSARVRRAFVRAKELGRPDIPAICREEARRLAIDEVRCLYYLQHVIRHDFGPTELEGLNRFYQLLVRYGLAPEGVSCVFYGEAHLAKSR